MQSQILPVLTVLPVIPAHFGVFQPDAPDPVSLLEGRGIWSREQLQDFAEQMATHGMAISCVRLRNDTGYTLRQLARAQAMDDEVLHQMAATLLHQFERNSPGDAVRLSNGSHS